MTTPSNDRTNTLILATAAGFTAVVGVVWAAAALACIASGQPSPVGLAATAHALTRLPAHVGEPGRAWTPALHLHPVVFWTAQVAVLASAALAARILWPRLRDARPGRHTLGAMPHVGIARRVPSLAVRRSVSGRLTLGHAGGQLVAAEEAASLAVIGPTGCGKTAGLVIPALLEWDGPILAASVKTDLLQATFAHRSSVGQVRVYDPTGITGDTPRAGWSPLDTSRTWADAQRSAAWMCDAAQPRNGSLSDADYWYSQARKAIAPHLYTAAVHGKTLAELVKWIDEQATDELFTLLDPDVRPDSQKALAVLQSLWMKDERLRSSIYATAETVLLAYADPGVQHAATLTARLDPSAWLTGDNTLYLIAPTYEQARLRPVFTVIAQAAIRAAYDHANRNGGQLAKPCLIVLDEAGNTAPLPDLAAYATTARSHGITLVTVWQDLAQLTDRYGRQAQTVLNNHRARLFGGGIADDTTLRYLSGLIGDQPRRELQRSTDLTGGRRTLNEHTVWRPAAPPDLLRRLPAESALLLYGAEAPTRLQLRPWYRDSRLRRLSQPNAAQQHGPA
jgi:type IV secretion system protein VirD4